MFHNLLIFFWSITTTHVSIDKQFNDMNFISVSLVFFLVLGQRLHFSITKSLSHLEIIEDLDSDYEKQQIFLSLETHLGPVPLVYIFFTKSMRERQ